MIRSNRHKIGLFYVPHDGAIGQSAIVPGALLYPVSARNATPARVPGGPLFFWQVKEDRISNRDTSGNRNRRNSPVNSQIQFSNRDEMRGGADYVANEFRMANFEFRRTD